MESDESRLRMLLVLTSGLIAFASPTVSLAYDDCARIYWCDTSESCEVWTENISSAKFDSSKPSLIYIHGYQDVGTGKFAIIPLPVHDEDASNGDPDWEFSYHEFKGDTVDFNVGIFYWKEFMSSWPSTTESYIWNGTDKYCADTLNGGTAYMSIVEMFDQEYDKTVDEGSEEIHIVAHSMGTELAIKFVDDLSGDYPYAVTMLEPNWASTTYSTTHKTRTLAVVAEGNVPIIMGKAYRFTTSTYQNNYIAMSQGMFDFWVNIDGDYDDQHRGVVDYWFEDQAPTLFDCYDCLRLWWQIAYPYAIWDQYGAEYYYKYVFPPGIFVLVYSWYERVQDCKTEDIMYGNFGASNKEYRGCALHESGDYKASPDGSDCDHY